MGIGMIMNLEDLKKPFQPREHKFNYEKWAYVDEDAITNRLDDVCGMGNWQLLHKSIERVTQTHYIATVDLQILTDNGWVTRSGTGEGTTSINKPYKDKDPLDDPRYVTNMGENAAKGAVTDAFRRAARLWGIGRYLLNLPKDENSKPTVINTEQLRKWLIDNYKKDDDQPTPPQKEQPIKNSQPVPDARERLKQWALTHPTVYIDEITVSGHQKIENQWNGWVNDLDGNRLGIAIWKDDIEPICDVAGIEPLKRNEIAKFDIPVPVKLTWRDDCGISIDRPHKKEIEPPVTADPKSASTVYGGTTPTVQRNVKTETKTTVSGVLFGNYNTWSDLLFDDPDIKALNYNHVNHVNKALFQHTDPRHTTYEQAKQFLIDRKRGTLEETKLRDALEGEYGELQPVDISEI